MKTSPAPPSPAPARHGILIVEDHPVVRAGLARVLEATPDLFLCGQTCGIQDTLALLPQVQPALLLVDLNLGRDNGLDLLQEVHRTAPELPMLVYTMFEETLYASRCLRAGAAGFIMKHERPETLVQAIRQVLHGMIYLSETMTRDLVNQMSNLKQPVQGAPSELLSDREFQVFEMLGQGRKTREIAVQLHLSVATVHTYREQIKNKLLLKDAPSLIRCAVQWAENRGESLRQRN